MIFQKIQKRTKTEYLLCGLRLAVIKTHGNIFEFRLLGIRILMLDRRRLKTKKYYGGYDMFHIIEMLLGQKINEKHIQIQHGWYALDNVVKSDFDSQKKVMLFWSKRCKEMWNKKGGFESYVIGSPFIHYRRLKNITQNPNARGTIAYPAHSLEEFQAQYDIDAYCEQLNSLPPEFHPITISLHYADIEFYNLDKEYEKRGFNTISSFTNKNKPFYETFYDILRQYKYATSNEPGSYLFYAVEMDIPFFIMGPTATRDNINLLTSDLEAKIISIQDFQYGKMAYDLFSNKARDNITQEQKDFVLSETGMNDCISTEELKNILEKLQ